jgi:8-oxo-dGTP pyrophosphatase MutT (NUDIX family)
MSGASSVGGQDAISILPVDRLDMRLTPHPWPFATERRGEIDAFFAERQRRHRGMWNGRVLLLCDFAVADGTFRGSFFETDFAAFHAWSQWGFPDGTVKNGFAAGALRSSDGAFVLGEMGPQTANAGHIYFPCGTPDPDDVTGSLVDLDASLRREIEEEIGIGEGDYQPEPGWFVILAGPRVAAIKVLQARDTATILRRRIEQAIARQAAPELASIHLVGSPADFAPMMPDFVTAFLSHFWRK